MVAKSRRRIACGKRFVDSLLGRSLMPSSLGVVRHLTDAPPGAPVVLYARCSSRWQREADLDAQKAKLKRAARTGGHPVVAKVQEVGPAYEPDRPKLLRVIKLAKEHGAIVVAENMTRLLRHPRFHPVTAPNLQATEGQIRELALLADGVCFYLIESPELTNAQVRGREVMRGQNASGNRGGRPKRAKAGAKKRRRELLMPRAKVLHEQGKSVRKIAQELGVRSSTAYDWIRCE